MICTVLNLLYIYSVPEACYKLWLKSSFQQQTEERLLICLLLIVIPETKYLADHLLVQDQVPPKRGNSKVSQLFFTTTIQYNKLYLGWGYLQVCVAWQKITFKKRSKRQVKLLYKIASQFNPLTAGPFFQKCVFWILWWFSACILAKLALICLPLPLALWFMTFCLGHAQKFKFFLAFPFPPFLFFLLLWLAFYWTCLELKKTSKKLSRRANLTME